MAIAVILVTVLPAAAREVLVVQSVRSSMYDDALRGFRSVCSADARTLVLSDYVDPELSRVINEERPRLLVAVGDGALASLRKVRRIPVLALMALDLPNQGGERANLTGVNVLVKPEQYLCLFRRLKAGRVGVLYDPARTGWYLSLARAAARDYGVELVLREVKSPRQALSQLSSLKGNVDALWLIPDLTAMTAETLEAYFLFAVGESVPVVSFSSAHLQLGALASVEADRVELGRQGGELAQQLLRGGERVELGLVSPRKVSVRVNDAVARRLRYPAELLAPYLRK